VSIENPPLRSRYLARSMAQVLAQSNTLDRAVGFVQVTVNVTGRRDHDA
jgi:hypothetical protein